MWEDKNSDEENQKGQALKISTSDERLSRLTITLAQLNTGNNSENLKNEIRQLLYSLNGSEKFTEKIYNSFINTI